MHFSASTFMAPYLHQLTAVLLFGTGLYYIWCQFCIIFLKIYAGTATSIVAILDEFYEQHQHQSIKKAPFLMPNYNFSANWLQI